MRNIAPSTRRIAQEQKANPTSAAPTASATTPGSADVKAMNLAASGDP